MSNSQPVTVPVTTDVDAPRSAPVPRKLTRAEQRAVDAKTRLTSPAASAIAVVIAIFWTLPTAGLLVTSVRPAADVRKDGWWNFFVQPNFTLDNYAEVLGQNSLGNNLINSFIITIPGVLIPILLALLAAYAFAWIDFKGRDWLFAAVFALQVVPIQVTLVPLLTTYVKAGIAGTFWTVWLSHTIFGLPLAIFLLHNFMKEIPRSLIEAARVDGAGHVRVFFQVLLPLLMPAIASFGIFQFLWVWNDLLVAMVFAGPANQPITATMAQMMTNKASRNDLLAPGAFIAMVVPLIVFLSLQRFFVRGLLAGGVKG